MNLQTVLICLLVSACIVPNQQTGQPGGVSVDIVSRYLLDLANKVERYDTDDDGRLQQNEASGLLTEMVADLMAQLLVGAPTSTQPAQPIAAPPSGDLSFKGGVPVGAMSRLLHELALDVVSVDVNPWDGALNGGELAALIVKAGGRIVGAAIAG